jgi:1,4-alpha-glucan branching enzyme
MLQKVYSKTGRACRVTFILPPDANADTAFLCGEFNDWNQTSHPLTPRKDGSLARMIWLESGRQYRFRYWVNDSRWENDWAADAYMPNPFGGDDSIASL